MMCGHPDERYFLTFATLHTGQEGDREQACIQYGWMGGQYQVWTVMLSYMYAVQPSQLKLENGLKAYQFSNELHCMIEI